MTTPVIDSLNDWLLQLMDGRPAEVRRYEFRCHPDVIIALRNASDVTPTGPWLPPGPVGLYGGADVIARTELGSGGWELYENGELLKSGRVGTEERSAS